MECEEKITIPYIKIFNDELEALEPFSDEEVGRLFRGMLRYMNGLDPVLQGNERYAWGVVKSQLVAQQKAYLKKVKSAAEAREARNKSDSEQSSNQSEVSMKTNSNQSEVSMKSEQEKTRDEKTRDEKTKKEKEPKKSYGVFGWVRLSESDYNRLIEEFGPEETERSIKYIDELAESTGNARKWKNWRLVVSRSCRDGWGKRIINKTIPTAAKKNYADKPEGWIDF